MTSGAGKYTVTTVERTFPLPLTVTLPLTAFSLRSEAFDLTERAKKFTRYARDLSAIADFMDNDAAEPPSDLTPSDLPPAEFTATSEPGPLSAAEAFARTPPPKPGSVPTVAGVPAPAPPPPPPPVPAEGALVDKFGTVWTKGVHADNKSKKQDLSWKMRRGGSKAPATNRADGGPAIDDVSLATFQAAMAKLSVCGEEMPGMITTDVSQTVFGDMGRTTGGIEHVLATGDAKLTGKAFNALKAIAVQTGNGSAI